MAFGDILQELRKDAHLKQEDIAKIVGVTRSTVGNYETGVAEPSIDTIKVLSRYFGVSIDYFFEETHIKLPVSALLNQISNGSQREFEEFLSNICTLSENDRKIVFTIAEALKIRCLETNRNNE